MKKSLKLSLIAGLLVVAGVAYSQSPMGGQCDYGMGSMGGMYGPHGMKQGRMGQMDPAKMQAMRDQRHAAMKAELKLTAAQESAWMAFTAAMKPMAGMKNTMQRPDPAEMAKLTTPERLEKMKAMRAQRMADMTAAMDQHAEATKTFYTALTPEQQKVFDAFAMQGPGRAPGGRAGRGPMQPAQ